MRFLGDHVMAQLVDFGTAPASYKHWTLEIVPPIATLKLKVDPSGGLRDDYELKLNSYDLGVDIELDDIVQRLRFEHPEVRVVVLTSGQERIFCAGANIQMLAGSSHHHKVNFCKFTNETRNSIEDATRNSEQIWIAAVNGTAAGGGYELALACDEIVLVDDRSSTISLPEVPLLAVLPGTGGLTRVVDKRHVRRDLADVFATKVDGVKGSQAVNWGLVDATVPRSRFAEFVTERALERAKLSNRPLQDKGILLTPLKRSETSEGMIYPNLQIRFDRDLGVAFFNLLVPSEVGTANIDEMIREGAEFWLLALCRELDDAILRLRFNEPELGTWVFESSGSPEVVLGFDEIIRLNYDHWLAREIRLYWARTLRRLELSSRSLITVVKQGSSFAGTLAEFVLVADQSFMLDGTLQDVPSPAPYMHLGDPNNGWYLMSNGLSRLESRFLGHPDKLQEVQNVFGKDLLASDSYELGLVTFIPDEIDFEDEVKLMLEERRSFSPDALTAMEANCRFAGPETMETKIFGRLSAWQNWVFQRPNAVGPDGALASYGTGSRPNYNRERI